MNSVTIPPHLMRNREWASMLHIFIECAKLRSYLTTKFLDLENQSVKVTSLKQLSRPWSQSERFMLNLALHCFNGRNKVDLYDMDYLDDKNMQIAMEAIRIRYNRR